MTVLELALEFALNTLKTDRRQPLGVAVALMVALASVLGLAPAFAHAQSSTLSSGSVSAPASESTSNSTSLSSATSAPAGSDTGTSKSKLFEDYTYRESSGLTDARLRAEQGSMSRYSGKFSFSYLGPVVGDMSNPYQPNPDHSVTRNPTAVRGNMAFRYRTSAETALNFGTGLSDVTPFADSSRRDMSTPFISFDHSNRVRAYQLREAIQASATTNPEQRNTGQVATLGTNFTVLRNINYSRWVAGFNTGLQLSFYNRPYIGASTTPGAPGASAHQKKGQKVTTQGIGATYSEGGDANAQQFSFGFNPTLKYQITDYLGSYTAVNVDYYEPRSSLGQTWLWEKTVSQSLGIEYSVTHDIYFSPYIAFYPSSPALATTTINFSTVFSVL